jgi:hypothetical protein
MIGELMFQGATYFSTQSLVAICIAVVPSIVAWIRLGPRVDRLEKETAAQGLEVREATKCLVKLTTLQEVAERRLERLESK